MLTVPTSFCRPLGMTFVVLCLTCVLGCVPIASNKPAAKYVNRDLKLTGDFFMQIGSTKERTPCSIKISDDEELPYTLTSPEVDDETFQVYTIGNLDLAFVANYHEEDEEREKILGYTVVRIQVTKTQIVAETLQKKFLEDNPAALPGTVVKKDAFATDLTIRSTPEQLALFFKLHQNTTGMFDAENRIIFRRIK